MYQRSGNKRTNETFSSHDSHRYSRKRIAGEDAVDRPVIQTSNLSRRQSTSDSLPVDHSPALSHTWNSAPLMQPFRWTPPGSDTPQAGRSPEHDQDTLRRVLAAFGDTIIAGARVALQDQQIQQQTTHQLNQSHRWQKHHRAFVSLAESHERLSKQLASKADVSKQEIGKIQEKQDQIIKTLIASLPAAGSSNAETSRNLEELISQNDSKLASLGSKYENLQFSLGENERMMTKHFDALDQHIEHNRKHEDEVQSLLSDFNTHKENLASLQSEIIGGGNGNSISLIDLCHQAIQRIEKLETAVRKLDDELETLPKQSTNVETSTDRLDTLEKHIGLPLSCEPPAGSATLDDRIGFLERRLRVNDEAISELLANFKVTTQQEMQSVSQRQEGISSSLDKWTEDFALFKAETSASLAKLAEMIDQQQVELLGSQRPPTPPPPPPTLPLAPDQALQPRLEKVEAGLKSFQASTTDRVDSVDLLIENLLQRFNNLSTEPLMMNIMHQIQKMYPFQSEHVQRELASIHGRMQQIDRFMNESSTRWNGFQAQMSHNSERVTQRLNLLPSSQTCTLLERRMDEIQSKSQDGFQKVSDGYRDLSVKLGTDLLEIKSHLQSTRNDVEALHKQVSALQNNMSINQNNVPPREMGFDPAQNHAPTKPDSDSEHIASEDDDDPPVKRSKRRPNRC